MVEIIGSINSALIRLASNLFGSEIKSFIVGDVEVNVSNSNKIKFTVTQRAYGGWSSWEEYTLNTDTGAIKYKDVPVCLRHNCLSERREAKIYKPNDGKVYIEVSKELSQILKKVLNSVLNKSGFKNLSEKARIVNAFEKMDELLKNKQAVAKTMGLMEKAIISSGDKALSALGALKK